jgi:hypothetical protein
MGFFDRVDDCTDGCWLYGLGLVMPNCATFGTSSDTRRVFSLSSLSLGGAGKTGFEEALIALLLK